MEQDCERSPCAYQVPVRLSRLWLPPPLPESHLAQNVPFDQLIRLPSGLRVPVTNCHPGALILFCPCSCPGEVSPLSLVKVRKAPLLLIDACFVESPWAHQAPVKAAADWFGGNCAAALSTLSMRPIVIQNKSNPVLTCLRCICFSSY